jgi:lipopolysaccharide/colanic/teichoic acid biosynthesis glycosyltransferase
MLLKRIFDISVSFAGLVILVPLLLLIAVVIMFTMPGPVIFIQVRAGKHGRPFKLFKFRTMIDSNDKNTITVKGDKRITGTGAFLRKYKLDELPELWNVLKGDMSLVGPRPDMPEFAARLTGEERLILELAPGITGPASLKYINEEELLANVSDPEKYNDEVIWPDKVRINLDYYRNRSLAGDILIILKTLFRIT